MKPAREHVTNNRQTYFVTATTWQRRALFNNERWASLFLETLHCAVHTNATSTCVGMEIWQRGFSDHRIRDLQDFETHVGYIYRNPVGRKLVESAVEYPYCSAFPGGTKDDVPQWLKPSKIGSSGGTAEAVPFQIFDTSNFRTCVALGRSWNKVPRSGTAELSPALQRWVGRNI